MGRVETQGHALGVNTRARHWSAIVATASIALLSLAIPATAQTPTTTTIISTSPNPSTPFQDFTIDVKVDAHGRPGATGSISFSSGSWTLGGTLLKLGDLGVGQVDAGGFHSCALANNGTVWCWGDNGSGQLGNGTNTSSLVPVQVTGITNAVSVSAGLNFSCAVLSTGTVTCWGANASGQLGNGGVASSNVPVTVSIINNATQVSAGGAHACSRGTDQSVRCWGSNTQGQLGDNTNTSRSTPGVILPPTGLFEHGYWSVSAGLNHTCAVVTDGRVTCWGDGDYYQLGYGDLFDMYRPTFVKTDFFTNLTGVLSVSAGGFHTCAVVENPSSPLNNLYCWGSNGNGRLGRTVAELSSSEFALPALNPSSAPGQLGTVYTGATAVSAGGFHTCVTQTNSYNRCFGAGGDGRLGNNSTADSDVVGSYVVASDGNHDQFVSVTAGEYSTCGVRIDGSLQCWGRGSSGEMGNGTTTTTNSQSVPVSNLNLKTISTASYISSPVPAGVNTIVATFPGNAMLAASSGSASHTVNKFNQSIGFITPVPAAVVNGPIYRPIAFAFPGLHVDFSIDHEDYARCQINDGNVSFTAVGLCRVHADQEGSAAVNPAPRVTQTITIGKMPQTISFVSSAPTSATFGGSYVPSASTSAGFTSGMIFSIASAAQSVCAINNGVVSFIGVGTCTVNANHNGSASVDVAPQVSQSFTVAKADQTVSFTTAAPTTAVFRGAGYVPGATATSGLAVSLSVAPASASVCALSGGVVAFNGVGMCTLNANQAGGPNHLPATQVSQSFVVGKAAQTLTFTSLAPSAAVFGGATYTPLVTATSGLAVALTVAPASASVCALNAGVVSFTGVGTCTLNANQAGGPNHVAATQVAQSFAVGKAPQTISFTSAAPTAAVFGATYTPVATSTSNLAVALSVAPASTGVCALTAGVVSFTGVGTCTLNANQAGGANHLAATQATQSFAVAKAPQTITFTSTAPAGAVFGQTYTPVATSTSNLMVALAVAPASASVCALNAGIVSFTGVGTCTLNANQAGGPNHVAATQVIQSFAVAKAPQTITFTSPAPTGAVFGQTYTPVATSTSNLAVALTVAPASASVCTLTAGLVSFTGVGTCTLNANQAGSANHLAATQATQSFAVAKAPQTITFTSTAPTGAVFGQTYTPLVTSTSNLAVALTVAPASASACTLTAGVVSFTGVGTCTLNANQAGGPNHLAATQVAQSFAIAKAPQTITFTSTAPTAAIFGGPTYTPVVTSTSNLVVALTVAPASTGVCALTAGVVSFTGVGTCTLNANQAGGPNHLAATQVTQSFTVAIATQTLTFTSTAPTTAVFGGPSYTPVVTATSNLPVTLSAAPTSAGVCAVAAGVVTFTGVGSCVVNADQAGNSVYAAATRISQTINVAKAGMTVALTAAASTVLPGATVQLTADVNATAPSTGRPSGTVTFRRHGVVIGSPVTVDANGIARITSPALPLGSNGFTATFSGGACCNAATSANVTVIATWAVGAEARLNTTVAGNQTNATIASLATGAVAVWEQSTTTTSASIIAQRLSQQGVKLGGEITVAATSPGAGAPQVSALDNGTFVVVWHENGPSGRDILMRRFSSAGVALGPEARANRSTTGEQAGPQVTAVAGGYIITWQTTGVDGSGAAVVFQRFTNAGAAVGTQVTVNTTTLGNQAGPAIATLSTGGFVVAWQGQVGSLFRVYARRFSATGIPAGGEIIIDASPTAVVPPIVAVTGLTGGAFAIAYDRTETASVTAPKDLYIERYAATGALTWQARANIAIAGSQLDPALASLGTDGVVVSWTTPDASGNAIDAQVFTPTGVRLQSTFRVNTAVTGNQRLSDIANTGGDGYILVWTSAGQDGTGDGVYFQRFINP